VLKFFFSTIILFIASVILIAEAAFAIPSIPGTQLMAQVNPSPNPVITPTDRGNVDESNRIDLQPILRQILKQPVPMRRKITISKQWTSLTGNCMERENNGVGG
jgi:hypothetical protein